MEVLAVSGASFAYGQHRVLDDVTFAVEAGEFVALAGGNGAGKSTLLRVILGLLAPSAGTVTLLDRREVGYVPQRPMVSELLPATVAEVVASGRLSRSWWRRLRDEDHAAVEAALMSVDLAEMGHRRFSELSGGQQQRVLIAKAIVNEPQLLILDEPIAGVDAASQEHFRHALTTRVARGCAVLLVSHELGAVADALDRVLLLAQGRIDFDGPPAELERTGVSLGMHDHDLPAWLENRP